ncbi:unnamed protein product [Larinioides sclopetarius]|uniref:Uncharacterized protein n=1 Tax=Larinioides sclopetarius TaxID=280406 RepID=A0AAV2AVA0_9ARAC
MTLAISDNQDNEFHHQGHRRTLIVQVLLPYGGQVLHQESELKLLDGPSHHTVAAWTSPDDPPYNERVDQLQIRLTPAIEGGWLLTIEQQLWCERAMAFRESVFRQTTTQRFQEEEEGWQEAEGQESVCDRERQRRRSAVAPWTQGDCVRGRVFASSLHFAGGSYPTFGTCDR